MVFVCAFASLLLVLAGCGGDDEDDGGGGGGAAASSEGPDTVTIGMQPVVEAAPIYLGIREGYFEEEGIEPELKLNPGGGAPITAQVVAGEIDIGFSNPTSLVLARANDLDVRVIAPASSAGTDEESASVWIVAKKDSGISGPQDLEGKTIAVNTLANILEITAKEALSKEGVDISTIKFTEVPFPDMPAALDGGDVDAIFTVEPFVTLALGNGAQRVFNPYERVLPELPSAEYFVTGQYLEENGDLIERFRRAMEKSTQYAIDNPEEVRAMVPEYTELDPTVVEEMRFAKFQPTIVPERYQPHIDLAVKYKLIPEAIPVEELLAE